MQRYHRLEQVFLAPFQSLSVVASVAHWPVTKPRSPFGELAPAASSSITLNLSQSHYKLTTTITVLTLPTVFPLDTRLVPELLVYRLPFSPTPFKLNYADAATSRGARTTRSSTTIVFHSSYSDSFSRISSHSHIETHHAAQQGTKQQRQEACRQ